MIERPTRTWPPNGLRPSGIAHEPSRNPSQTTESPGPTPARRAPAVARRYGFRVLSVVTASLLQAAWLALFARSLGAAAFGVFGVISAWCAFAYVAVGFGLGQYSLRLTDSNETHRSVVSTMLITRLASIGAVTLGTAVVVRGLGLDIGTAGTLAVLAASLEFISDLTQGVLSGQRQIEYAGAILVGQRTATIAGFGLGQFAGAPESGLAVGLVASILICVAPLVRHLGRPVSLRFVFRSAKFFWTSSLAANLSQLDVPLVSMLAGPTSTLR